MKKDIYKVTTLGELEKSISKSESYSGISFNADEAKLYLSMYLQDTLRWSLVTGPYKSKMEQRPEVEKDESVNANGGDTEEFEAAEAPDADDTIPPSQEDVDEIIDRAYKQIVLSWKYDRDMLAICRAAKFTRGDVEAACKAAMEDIEEDLDEYGKVTPWSKSLARSIRRVSEEVGADISKSDYGDWDAVMGTSVAYPRRVVMFLKSQRKDKGENLVVNK